MAEFEIRDSGARAEFEGGMVRDTTEGKIDFTNVHYGPMLRRWATHSTKGREKYPDPEPGIPNWTLGQGIDVWLRARESFRRHMEQWLSGDLGEDHAAALYFNINLKEYVQARLSEEELALTRRIEDLGADVTLSNTADPDGVREIYRPESGEVLELVNPPPRAVPSRLHPKVLGCNCLLCRRNRT